MPKPRYTQVSLEATSYYHCVSRCVRRAFLCGSDPVTDQCYEHRRGWIEEKLLSLGEVFAIDVGAYAVMSNHYHVVLYVDVAMADTWSVDEVIDRWHRLFAGNALSQRYQRGEAFSPAERLVLDECVLKWRARLQDISWFMRVLNETIARQANAEDNCTGRFWEGRFKSQALLDEAALATCLAYVDLNPIRAKLAETPEASEFTSIKQRIEKAQAVEHPQDLYQQPSGLLPFAGNPRRDMPKGLPFCLIDYLELVDWTGRIIREDKRGSIAASTPPILERLNLGSKQWLYLTQHFESPFKGLVGSVSKLKQACASFGYKRTPGQQYCANYFP